MLTALQERRHLSALLAALSVVGAASAIDDATSWSTVLWGTLTYALTALALGGWRFLWIVCRTFRRDIRAILVFVQMKLIIRKHVKNEENIPSLWNKTVERFGGKTCFFFEDETWSFHEVRKRERGGLIVDFQFQLFPRSDLWLFCCRDRNHTFATALT